MNLNFLTKKEKRFGLNVCKTFCFFGSPQKAFGNAFIFFTSISLKSFKEILSKFLHFWEKKCFQTKICVNMTSQRMYEEGANEPIRCMEAGAYKQREQKEVGTNHYPVKGQPLHDR